jgi:ATP synthase F1 delta subunit
VQPLLRGYVTAVVDQAVRQELGERLADELNAVAHLVSRTNDLAVTLTDFGVPVGARRALLEDLLAPRVHPLVLRVVLWAVQTERADELPTTLHELYELVRHLHEMAPGQMRAAEPIVGRTAWRQYAAGFAAALFEASTDSDEIAQVEDELFRFARIVESTPALRVALADPNTPPHLRRALLGDLLGGKARPDTLQLATLLTVGHVRDAVASLDWLVEQAAQARGWRVARVRSAWPIEAEGRQQLAEALERITAQPVELQVTEDPALLGGAVVQIGDLLVDASAEHRLDQLGERLLSTAETTYGVSS